MNIRCWIYIFIFVFSWAVVVSVNCASMSLFTLLGSHFIQVDCGFHLCALYELYKSMYIYNTKLHKKVSYN